ncbi:MAG: ABC transporter ATP-binding protein [Acidimicrobiia bacterium]|nr:ABC transporter ATP-binding protein [Acidimicrobiia bacterium]
MTAIEVDRLVKRYGGFTAVDELSLAIHPGETYALLGPNGAGKTTTIEILEGLRNRTEGEVRVLGLDPWTQKAEVHARVGVMLQEGGMYPGARVRELMDLFAALYPDPRDVDELLELVGLTEHQRSIERKLSGGQKQRLSLAVALIGRPELVFLDEPTAGMDPVARRTTWEIIEALQEEGVTMVLTTHYMEEAERLADRVGIVNRGRLLAEGTPDELTAGGGEVRIRAAEPIDSVALRSAIGHPVRDLGRGSVIVEAKATPELVAEVSAWCAAAGVLVSELRVGAAGLEEVFLEIAAEDEL